MFTLSSDRAKIKRVLGGDVGAFRVLVERYGGLVAGVAYAHLGNHAEAEDVVQETFFRLYQKLNTVLCERSLGPWLVRVARNVCFDLLRKQGREREKLSAVAHEKSVRPNPADEEMRRLLTEQLNTLEPDDREVLVLYYFQKKRRGEIAAALEISASAASKRIERARRRLGERFEALLGQDTEREDAEKRRTERVMSAVAGMPLTWPSGAGGGVGSSWSSIGYSACAVLIVVGAGVAVWRGGGTIEPVAREAAAPATIAAVPPAVAPTPPRRQAPIRQDIQPEKPQHGPSALSGVVYTEQGEALGGAQISVIGTGLPQMPRPYVNVYDEFAAALRSPHIYSAVTDADGYFSLAGLDYVGHAAVRVLSDEYSGGAQIVLEEGKEAEVEILATPSAVFQGRVLAPDGSPLAKAAVKAVEFNPTDGGAWTYGPMSYDWIVACTDEAGLFEIGLPRRTGDADFLVFAAGNPQAAFKHVPTGSDHITELRLQPSAVVSGHVSGLRPCERTVVHLSAENGQLYKAMTDADGNYECEVAPGEGYVVMLESNKYELGTLRAGERKRFDVGQVKSAIITGRVLSKASRKPVASAAVGVYDAGEKQSAEVLTNDSGEFRLEVAPGNYSLATGKYGVVLGPSAVRVECQAGQTCEVELELSENTRTIQVLDETGHAVADADVSVTTQTAPHCYQILQNAGKTNAGGLFESQFVPGVKYIVSVAKKGFAATSSAEFDGPSQSRETLLLYRSGGIEGVAVWPDGTPITDAEVRIKVECPRYRHEEMIIRTDGNGIFTVLDGLPATEVQLTLRISVKSEEGSEEYSAHVRPVTCEAGLVIDLGTVTFTSKD